MDDLVVFENGKAIGFVAPSTVYGAEEGSTFINGPLGITKLLCEDEASLVSALKRSGSFISGSSEEIDKIKQLLASPETSRTSSYFLCTAENCSSVIKKFEILHKSHVILLGCGGIGSSLAMILAGAGVRKLTLIDPDTIEKSNLNRQLFWEKEDIGLLKVNVLKKCLLKRFDSLTVNCIPEEMSIPQLVNLASKECDGTAVTADNPGSLASDARQIARTCNIPTVSGGYFHHHCVANIFSASGHDTEDLPNTLMHNWIRLPHSIMPSYGPINMALASILASGLIAAIVGDGNIEDQIVRWDSSMNPFQPRII